MHLIIFSQLMATSFDWNRAVPFALLLLAWLMVVHALVQGLRHGRMRVYRRNEGSDEMDDRPALYCYRADSPKSFRGLFVFYSVLAVLIPCMMTAALLYEPSEPARNPGGGTQQTSGGDSS